MRKRVIAGLILLALISTFIPAYAQAESEYLETAVLFECDFENNLEPNKGTMTFGNASVSESGKNNKVLALNSRAGSANFIAYADSPEECEATLISLDMQFDSKVCRGYMDIFKPVEKGKTPSFDVQKIYRSLYVTHQNRISYFEKLAYPSGTMVYNNLLYNTGQWYHFDMWIDYPKNTVYYYVDGVEIGTVPIDDETFTAVGGFRMTVENMNGGATYLFDNVRIVNFPKRGKKVPYDGVGVPDNFENPISIEYLTKENNIGFIFKEKTVEFNSTLSNVTEDDKTVIAESRITDEENKEIATKTDEVTLKSGSEEKLNFKASVEKFGFYYLETTVKDKESGETISNQKFQFSVMNAPAEGVRNRKFGLGDHTAGGQGSVERDRKIELMADAGAGGLRIEYIRDRTTFREDGTYKLNDELRRNLENAVKNDLEQVAILTYGKIPPVTNAEYAEWEKYVEAVVTQITEIKKEHQIIRYDVWNEYNGAGFNYIGATSSDYVNLLKHTYPIIKRIDPKAEVWGMAASPTIKPNSPQDAIEWVREVFEQGGGDYMDVACIHTYTHAAPEDIYSKRGIFLDETRALLDEFGYNDMKIGISEMGWTTPGVVDEMGQAGYIVRWSALNYDKFSEIYWYVNQETQTNSAHENGFGFIRSWTKQYAGEYPIFAAKPVFLSYANYNALMTDAVFEEEIEKTEGGTHIFKFKLKDGKRATILWNASDAEETVGLKMNTDSVMLYDIYGNPTQLHSTSDGHFTVDISGIPVYVIGDYTTCERVEQSFFNLTEYVETSEGDSAYIRFKNNSGKNVKLELDLPVNITEGQRSGDEIKLNIGNNSVENEKIHISVVDAVTGVCYYKYDIPVLYKDAVTCELKPSYFRNGRWQCVLEVKNNLYTKSLSGEIVIKEPVELKGESARLKFNNLLPRDVKLLRINVPQNMAGANLELTYDLIINSEKEAENVKNNVYLTAMTRMKNPPEIDGELEYGEWNKLMPILINDESQVKLNPDWSGKEDLNAKIYCSYDADNFYMAAEITDDILYDKDELARAWAVDGIQFAFAKARVASAARTEYGIALANGVPKVDRYSFIGVNAGIIDEKDVDVYEDVELKVKRVGNKTIYESKFPWEQIYGEKIDIDGMNEVYFSVLVNENDGFGRNGWLEYCGGIGDGKSAALFIPVELNKD